MNARKRNTIAWLAQLAAAGILLQTLFFKFTAHPSSVQIFSELGLEPHGRLLVGVAELLAGALLLARPTAAFGALLAAGLMCGALAGHATTLGWAGDRLSLALLAVATLGCSAAVVWIRRGDLARAARLLRPKR